VWKIVRGVKETLQPQTADTHRDDKHPAEAVYPPTDQTRHTDVSTDQTRHTDVSTDQTRHTAVSTDKIKEKNHCRVNLDSKATKSYI